MIAFERRASTVLYNILRSHRDPRPFLIPANICPIVPVTFLEAQQPFELVDIAEPWLEIDRSLALARLQARASGYAGLLFVRPYGSERAPAAFFAELRALQSDLLLIDDQCLCPPDCDGFSLCPNADVTLFSTGERKYTDLGMGGFAHLSDRLAYHSEPSRFAAEALAAVTGLYKDALATRTPYLHPNAGWLDRRPPEASWEDYRRRTIVATATARPQKNALNEIYVRALPPEIQLPAEMQKWRFTVRVPDPDRLIQAAFAEGLFAGRHYPSLGGVLVSGSFPVADRLHATVVNLFNDQHFDESQAKRMAELVVRHLEAHR